MTTMPPESQHSNAMQVYGMGQTFFERGQYREAIDCFQQTLTLTHEQSTLGGAVQLWLVTAYDAVGQRQAALDLCRQLDTHSDRETRQKSRQLLYILEAPKLQLRSEWLTQIPDLSEPDGFNRSMQSGQPKPSQKPKPDPPLTVQPFEPIDPKDSRGFLSLAFAASMVALMALWWLSQHR
ncbi:MAG: hypothetical protein WCD18_14790 [Thermosynechococcaceae cyanobacterium]